MLERNVCLLDFDDFNNNSYHVTDEWRHKTPRFANRADVVFLINGILVATCETKNAGKKDGLAEGVAQIRRYQRQTPELFTAAQVFEVTELFRFVYAPTWNANRKALTNWKTELGAGSFAHAGHFGQLVQGYNVQIIERAEAGLGKSTDRGRAHAADAAEEVEG